MASLGKIPEDLKLLLIEDLPGLAASIDAEGVVPREFLDKLRDAGAFALDKLSSLLEAVRLAAMSSPAVAHVILINGMAKLALGKAVPEDVVVAVSITEPGSGSDVKASLRTVAEEQGDKASITGLKVFTSNAIYATHFLVLANGPEGPTLYLVERGPGVTVEPMDLTVFRGAGVGKVEYKSAGAVRVGKPGKGLREALEAINAGRLGYAAIGLGIAEGALRETIRYTRERIVFGKPILEYQGPRWMLAEIYVDLKLLEAHVSKVISRAEEEGRVDPLDAAVAKIAAAKLAQRAAWTAVQLHGGIGLTRGSLTERLYRDSRVLDIGEGAREVILDFVAAMLQRTLQ